MLKTIGASALALAMAANSAQALSLTSPDIKPGARIADEQVFSAFGCTGKNISPALSWKDAPKGTKSFALSVYDPDAPTGSGFWHWVVFNIPADVTSLAKGAGAEEIVRAHRSLMKKLHPDHGGSTALAARVNQAKDVLLGRHG